MQEMQEKAQMQEKVLMIFLMNILQEYLKLNIKENKEQDLKS